MAMLACGAKARLIGLRCPNARMFCLINCRPTRSDEVNGIHLRARRRSAPPPSIREAAAIVLDGGHQEFVGALFW